jgi:hypothetical protein
MSKNERLVGYVNSETKTSVEQLAEQKGQSVSEYVAEAVGEKVERDKLGSISEEYSVEMKLLRMVQGASEKMVDEVSEEVAGQIVDDLADRGLLDASADSTDDSDDDGQWSVSG